MAGPLQPATPASAKLDVGSVVLLGGLGALLIAGYVVLAALGRDVTGYVLFLGGPAVTGVLGVILNQRVKHVAAAVDATQTHTTAVVAEQVSGLDSHLAAQDETLGAIAAGVNGDPAPASTSSSSRQLPAARDGYEASVPLFAPNVRRP